MTTDTINSNRRRIAIIGGGVSGLSAAYFLEESSDFEVTLYERLDRLGGNALTVDAQTPDGKPYAVDPVAYLFIKQRYPYFTAWLRQLGVKTLPLSFENYLWNGNRNRGTFITSDLKKVLFYPGRSMEYFRNLYLFKQVIKTVDKLERQGKLHDRMLMKEFMEHVPHVNSKFLSEVFYPLMTFAFHTDYDSMADKPCGTTLRTYANAAKDPGAAYIVDGGVRTYIDTVRKSLAKTKVRMNANVQAVRKAGQENPLWYVTTADGTTHEYDQVLLAMWPNQAAEVLKNGLEQGVEVPELREMTDVLSKVDLAYCRATVHNDASTMPVDKRHWSTYCYRFKPNLKFALGTIWSGQSRNAKIFTTYDWSLEQHGVSDESVLTKVERPVYDIHFHVRTPPRMALYDAQAHVKTNQGYNGLWFTGCFMRETGFHEDGLATTIDVLKTLVPDYQKLPRLRRLLDAAPVSY